MMILKMPPKKFCILSLVVIILLNLLLFTPSLFLPIRDMDQIGYLAELDGAASFQEGLRLLDYGLVRRYAKGDELLFRPLTFAWLALQNSFYTHHALYWNITGLLLHTVNLMILFFLLFTIYPSPFALLFTLTAGTLRSAMPLTVNIHLGGYLLGYAFYFLGLLILYRSIRREKIGPFSLPLYAFLTSIACFFYELIIPFSLIALIFFKFQQTELKSRKRILFILAPCLIYTAVYLTRNFSATSHFFYVDKIDQEVSSNLFSNKTFLLAFTDSAAMLHSLFTRIFTWPPYQILIIGSGLTAVLFPAIFSPAHPLPIRIRVFPGVLLLVYVAFLSFLRTNIYRDYYPYLFALFFVIFIYSLLDFKKLDFKKNAFLTGVLMFTILFNFFYRWKESNADIESYAPMTRYFSQLSDFSDLHRREDDFTFSIENQETGIDLPFELKTGYPGAPGTVEIKSISEIIFSRYYQKSNPKYLLSWNEDQALFHLKEKK